VSERSNKAQGAFGRLWGGKSTSDAAPAEPTTATPNEAPAKAAGWFGRLKQGLGKTSAKLSDGITGIFTKKKLEAATLDDLEDLLIEADLGVGTAENIIMALRKGRFDKGISADDVRSVLKSEVARVLAPIAKPLVVDGAHKPHVILVVGVNGTGKTTTIGKLAAQLHSDGKQVMLAAADTFRAAAIEQLERWGERIGVEVIRQVAGSDPAAVVFDAVKAATARSLDVLIVDTAGRLHTKTNLMDELAKLRRVVERQLPGAPHETLMVLDAPTGQNGFAQARMFHEAIGLTGVCLTKLDGTAKGGIVVRIVRELGVPIKAIGVGEKVEDLQAFDPVRFVDALVPEG
jgi:fused signal recognition particle receptor